MKRDHFIKKERQYNSVQNKTVPLDNQTSFFINYCIEKEVE